MTDSQSLDLATTALVLIDLQAGIVGRTTAPHPSATVVGNAARIAERFRAASSLVALVRVTFAADGSDMNKNPVDDASMSAYTPPEGWDRLVPEIGPKPGDVVITKRNWGAFYGTDLDLHLRRRDVRTIVLGGIATNLGVESTARSAYEHNYGLVFVEDAMAGLDADSHEFAIKKIFPRLGRVRSTEQVLAGLS